MIDKINNGYNKDKIINLKKKVIKLKKIKKRKRKKVNIRHKLAIKKYIDPKSDTFLKRSKSLQAVGYKKGYANNKSVEMLSKIKVEDINLKEFNTFLNDIPSLSSLLRKKINLLASSDDIKAKDYANIIRHIELLAKFAGIIKNITENKSINVNIDIPISKCPKCGYIMDIMKEG